MTGAFGACLVVLAAGIAAAATYMAPLLHLVGGLS